MLEEDKRRKKNEEQFTGKMPISHNMCLGLLIREVRIKTQ